MRLSNQAIVNAIVLVVAGDRDDLTNQRMERIGDHGFVCQKPGTMAPARMKAAEHGRSSRRLSTAQNSLVSIHKNI
jgi:hypothetical protein